MRPGGHDALNGRLMFMFIPLQSSRLLGVLDVVMPVQIVLHTTVVSQVIREHLEGKLCHKQSRETIES